MWSSRYIVVVFHRTEGVGILVNVYTFLGARTGENTLTFLVLHVWHPARDFLCGRLVTKVEAIVD